MIMKEVYIDRHVSKRWVVARRDAGAMRRAYAPFRENRGAPLPRRADNPPFRDKPYWPLVEQLCIFGREPSW